MANKIRCCHNCAYSYWDRELARECMEVGLFHWPACANHPGSGGRMRRTPPRGICRNYRPRAEEPEGEFKQIPLGDGIYTYVDAADYKWLSQWNWRWQNGYAGRWDGKRKKVVYMHREIMQPPPGMIIDHKNRNKLDNTRDNLRHATRAENLRNKTKQHGTSSQYLGVSYNRLRNKYHASIRRKGDACCLGLHIEEIDAARAYDRAAVEVFGEFARLNFPEEWPPQRRAEAAAQRWVESLVRERKAKRAERRRKSRAKQPKASGRKTHDAKRATKPGRGTRRKQKNKSRRK